MRTTTLAMFSLCLLCSMTTYLRHVSTIYANLTALYSIGQSVQVRDAVLG